MQVLEVPTTTTEVFFSPLLRQYTLEELWTLPEPADRSHYELIGGWLFMSLPPDWPHGDFDARLKKSLILFLAGQGDPETSTTRAKLSTLTTPTSNLT